MNQVSYNPIRLIYVNLIAILLSQKNPKSKSWKMLKARLELICWWVTSCTFKLLKLTFDFQLSCTTLIGLKKKMCNKTIWSLIFGISCFQFSYLEMKSHISDEGVTEREIVPNTGTNATKFFTLATKSWKLVAKLATRMLHHNLT